MNNVVIVSATRTAVGKFGGSLINILAKYDRIFPLAAGKALKDVYSGKSYE